MQKIEPTSRVTHLWAAIAFLAMVPVASAEVIVQPVGIRIPAEGDSRGLLFVGIADGQTEAVEEPIAEPEWADFYLWVTAFEGGVYSQIQSHYFDDDVSNVNVAFTNHDDVAPLYWARQLAQGEPVGPGDFFMTNSVLLWCCQEDDPEGFPGDWPAGFSGYLGMEIYLDLDDNPETDSPHYGWLYIGISKSSEFYVFEYGYETTPGLRVFAPEPAEVIGSLLGLATLAVVAPFPRRRSTFRASRMH